MSQTQNNNNNLNTEERGIEGCFVKSYFASKLIPNVGSTARDHLASERTFLAWLRTSLALVTIGLAISQIGTLVNASEARKKESIILGSVYICIGMVFLIVGVSRYFYIQNQLLNSNFPAARYTILLGVALLGLVIGTLLVTVFLELA